jgi:hypothetical protein
VLDSALSNRYVLLLFFDKETAQKLGPKAEIQHALGQPIPDEPGCIRDPDQDAEGMRGIIVQGSCPTDCAHRSVKEVGAEIKPEKKPKGGDPLKRTTIKLGNSKIPGRQIFGHQKAVWALYLADPKGAKEEADGVKEEEDGAREKADGETQPKDDDPDLKFLVWQILAKDACHAGSILKSLKQSTDDITKKAFTKEDGYLGQIMIGYTPRWKLNKSVSTTECEAVEPRPSESVF